MFREFAAALMIAVWLVLSCGLGFAHHSVAANFDQTKTMDVTRKIK